MCSNSINEREMSSQSYPIAWSSKYSTLSSYTLKLLQLNIGVISYCFCLVTVTVEISQGGVEIKSAEVKSESDLFESF